MARASRPWFRFYVEAVSDVKLRRLAPSQRWLWVAVLAAARQSPQPGRLVIGGQEPMTDRDLAVFADMPVKEVAKTMPLFEKVGMLTRTDLGAWSVTNWQDRQYESDNTTERTRKHRSNHPPQNTDGTFQHGSRERSGAVLGTMTDTETDSEPLPRSFPDPQPPPPDTAQTEEDEDLPSPPSGIVGAAMAHLATRALAANPTPVANRPAWLAKVARQRHDQHQAAIAALDLGYFADGADLADHLEPPRRAATPPAGVGDTQRAADHARAADNEGRARQACPACDGNRRVENLAGIAITCDACHGTGIAA